MTPIPNVTRRRVISAFRFHCGRSPAESAALLTAYAVERGLSDPRRPPPGSALEQWAIATKPPLWAVQAAASWLHTYAAVTDPDERAAVAEVLEQIGGGGVTVSHAKNSPFSDGRGRDELERFKADINLTEYGATEGYSGSSTEF